MKKNLFKFLTAVSMLWGFMANAQLTVTNTNDTGPGSFRQAVLDAEDGNAITFNEATDGSTITFTSEVIIDKALIINGNGNSETLFSGGDATRMLRLTDAGDVVINNISFSHGMTAGNGGAISSTGTELMLNNCSVYDNSAQNGGAIYTATGTLTVNNCFITDNEVSGNGAGIFFDSGSAAINGGAISNNTATGNGGGIWAADGLTVNGTTINVNTAGSGGAIYNDTGAVAVIVQATVSNNTAAGAGSSGGGIYNATGSELSIITSSVLDNTAIVSGGGIANYGSSLVAINTQINNNSVTGAQGKGGGVYNNAPENSAINICTIKNNTAAQQGGGIWNGTGDLSLAGITVEDNIAEGDEPTDGGGGLYNNGGTVQAGSCTFTGNMANGTSGSGGAIFSTAGSVTIVDDSVSASSVIAENSANRAGGAIEAVSGAISVSGTVITGNDANGTAGMPNPGNGGGIHTSGNAVLILLNMEITENTAASQGGGLWLGNGVLSVTGGIIENNTAEGDLITDGGGGIFNNNSAVEIIDSFIEGNRATGTNGSGGGIFTVANSFNITNTTVNENSANRYGGGIEVSGGNIALHSSTVDGNDVNGTAGTANPGFGGGIHNSGTASVILDNCMVSNNAAKQQGGGLWNQNGTMVLASCTVRTNQANGDAVTDGGGGIYNNSGTMVAVASAVVGNVANGLLARGGALYVNSGTAELNLNTISGNGASGIGGAIYNNGTLNVKANTLTSNSAIQNGGGIYNNATATLKNTIVAGNIASIQGKDVYSNGGLIASDGYNLIGMDETNAFDANENDLEGTLTSPIDARLLPLADNGSNTLSHAFDCPSPAADMGDPADTSGDQIGGAVFNGRRDIGSFEAQEDCTLSNDEFLAAASMVYPNPSVNGKFTLELAGHAGIANISVYEAATGKLVKQLKTDSISTEISLQNVATGIYIMQIVSENASEIHKLIVGK